LKKIFQNIINKFSFLKFLGNRYVLVLIPFSIWMIFLDNFSYLEHRILNKEIEELENTESYYINEIKKDSAKIKQLKNSDQIEKYAREKYFMKRENEDIYLIEYEEDKTEKSE
jgi:cell division protein DivIC